jgi:hypothetical protein
MRPFRLTFLGLLDRSREGESCHMALLPSMLAPARLVIGEFQETCTLTGVGSLTTKPRGRPARSPVEVERTIAWYYRVREVSGLSESKLEIAFDECDRAARGMHRGSRWNKYKAGIASPRRELLERVERLFPMSLPVFDHPLWLLLGSEQLGASTLRQALCSLPKDLTVRLVDESAPSSSQFWLRSTPDEREVSTLMVSWRPKSNVDRLSLLAALVALAHLAVMRQDEEAHYACHAAIASAAHRPLAGRFPEPQAWRLESMLLLAWLRTEYRHPRLRAVMAELRTIRTGPPVPWASPQGALRLGRDANKKETSDLQHARGYWVAQRLLQTRLLSAEA